MNLTNKELNLIASSKKVWNYYNNDFVTDYPTKAVQLPLGRTIKDTLVSDNWISKTVNRFASATVGKYSSIETEDAKLAEYIALWHEAIDFESKITSIARYQGLFGYAVVKLVFTFPRDADGGIMVSTPEEFLQGIDLAVFGSDKAIVRYDEYGKQDSVLIQVGKTLEVFYSDRIERYEITSGGLYKLISTESTPIGPLVFVVNNLETGVNSNSDIHHIVTLQEALNDALTSLRLVTHYHGFPIYTATGVTPAYDEDGKAKPMIMGAGMTLQTEDPDAKFGRVEMPQITPLKESIEELTKEIAVATNSLSLLTGQAPSGVALAYLQSDFQAAVTEKQMKISNFIKKLHHTIFKLIDYTYTTSFSKSGFKVFVAGYNPILADLNFQQAKELYSLGSITRKTLLDAADVVENTQAELDALATEGAASPDGLTALLRG
ncbi:MULTISPECIES: phage portal protein [Deinococcus]|uniref:Phage portal protein n=1 Tax=Deinococcus rufus TaxID=2136097 RepID=A0ABV7Z7U2_9DEIO|nr:phage portal protein [Deinococcus sp. AB2017081]WQE94424.1 phage portal protein [Deinococcus sp. AB2017081]